MDSLLTRHQLVAHWAPGALFIGALLPLFYDLSWSQTMNSLSQHPTVSLSAFAIAAFLLGEILDSTRDLAEQLLDLVYKRFNCNLLKKLVKKVYWDFFAEAKGEQLDNLENYYFVYYVFNINSFLALFITASIFWISGQLHELPPVIKYIGIIFGLVLFF
jgi:hypothetical protein